METFSVFCYDLYRMLTRLLLFAALPLLFLLPSCFGVGSGGVSGVSPEARVVEKPEDLVGGEGAQAMPGDIVMENEFIRVVIQGVRNTPESRSMLGPYGGNIIDLDIRRKPGEQGQDFLAELVPFYNFGRTIKPREVVIRDDGLASGVAIVEVNGDDALFYPIHFETIAHSLIGSVADQPIFTNSLTGRRFSSDTPLPGLRWRTRYILGKGLPVLLVETMAINETGSDLELVVGDLVSLLGGGAFYQGGGTGIFTGAPAQGFGVPSGEMGYNGGEFLGWEGKEGLSFLYYPLVPQASPLQGATACITYFGVSGCLLGGELSLLGLRPLNDTFPGNPKDYFLFVPNRGVATYRRLISIGGNGIASAYEGVLRWKKIETTQIQGKIVDSQGNPVPKADLALFLEKDGTWLPWLHTRSDTQGAYRFTVPPGSYLIAPHHPDYAYNPDPSCGSHVRVLVPDQPVSETEVPALCLGATGTLELFVWDHRHNPLPARVLVLGAVANPPTVSVSGSAFSYGALPGQNLFSPFRERTMDPLPELPPGIITSAIPLADASGVLDPRTVSVVAGFFTHENGEGKVQLPPGEYRLLVTRGPLYHAVVTSVTIPAGTITRKLVTLPQIAEVTGYVTADLHVHAQNSPDSVLSFEDRLRSARGEGVDFFASTDHEFITDYAPKLLALELNLPLVVPGEELTTFDFGHFNGYPLRADPVPLRHLAFPYADETLNASSLQGGAVPWVSESGDQNLPPEDVLLRLKTRGGGVQGGAFQGNGITQLNHPHNGDFMGLFEQLDLRFDFTKGYDPDLNTPPLERLPPLPSSAMQPGSNAVANEALRLPSGIFPLTDRWETFEVANAGYSLAYVWRNLNDAIGFLNLGKVPVFVGTSDSHNRFSPPIGTMRTFVQIATTPVTLNSSLIPAILEGIRNGRSFVSNAPILTVTGTAVVTVDTTLERYGPVGPGGVLFPRLAGERFTLNPPLSYDLIVTLSVELKSPIYAPITEVVVLSNAPYLSLKPGQWDIEGTEYFSRLPRLCTYSFPDPSTLVVPAVLEAGGASVTTGASLYFWKGTCTLRITNQFTPPPQERWFIVVARGSTPMYPAVLQGREIPKPFALTNPIFLDFDGDGYPSDAPCRKPNSPSCPNLP